MTHDPSTAFRLACSAVLAAALLQAGCANTDRATFVTKTSLALFDADTAPGELSFGLHRFEGYVGPRLKDGSVYPVVGFFATDGQLLDRAIWQVFAGGDAATIVTATDSPPGAPKPSRRSAAPTGAGEALAPARPDCASAVDNPPLILSTSSSVGIRLGFVTGSPLPNALTFGYRRKEASSVPVSAGCTPSVLATIDTGYAARRTEADPKLADRTTQYIATGRAADQLAATDDVRRAFDAERGAALRNVAAFDARNREQAQSLLRALGCTAVLDDAGFARAVDDATARGLYAEPEVAGGVRTAARPRQAHVGALRLRLGDAGDFGARLSEHEKAVCALAGRP